MKTREFTLSRTQFGEKQTFNIIDYGNNVYIFSIDKNQYLIGWEEAEKLKEFLKVKL